MLKEAFRLGQMGAEEYQRAVLVPAVRGKREPKGRMISDSDIRALMQLCSADPTPMGATPRLSRCGMATSRVALSRTHRLSFIVIPVEMQVVK